MFVEFTLCNTGTGLSLSSIESPVLIDTGHVIYVTRSNIGNSCIYTKDMCFYLVESFEEVKKRLGMTITPRAETIAS